MNTLDKYTPSFYGKGGEEERSIWNTLISANDFAALISSQKRRLIVYIANLRKAEIFEQCDYAIAELKRIRSYLTWEEDYSLNYRVYTTLSLYTENVDEFIAHSNGSTDVTADWVVTQFREWYGGDSLEWELSDRYGESIPGEICISSLSVISTSAEQELLPIFAAN